MFSGAARDAPDSVQAATAKSQNILISFAIFARKRRKVSKKFSP